MKSSRYPHLVAKLRRPLELRRSQPDCLCSHCLGLASFAAAERPPKVEIWAVLAVFGLLGLFLTNVGYRLTFNRPKPDGGLLGPFLLGLLGSMFALGGVLLIYTTWCGTCETSISDQFAPGGFSLLFGAALLLCAMEEKA